MKVYQVLVYGNPLTSTNTDKGRDFHTTLTWEEASNLKLQWEKLGCKSVTIIDTTTTQEKK